MSLFELVFGNKLHVNVDAPDIAHGLNRIAAAIKHLQGADNPTGPRLYFSALTYQGGPIVKGNIMAFELKDNQEVVVTAQAVDAKGNPAAIQPGTAKWTSSDETVATVTPDPANELSASVKAVGPVGVATISLSADADPSADVDTEISAAGEVAVVGGIGTGFAPLSFGTPTDQA